MRIVLLVLPLSLAACSAGTPPGPAPGTFAGAGKDRLCISGAEQMLRAGLIAYAPDGAANCCLSGKLEKSPNGWTLTPRGEGACQVGLSIAGDKISVASVPASCSYYCGPGASLAGKRFTRDPKVAPAVDLAGDPLCS